MMSCCLWHWFYNLAVMPLLVAVSRVGSLILPKLRQRHHHLKQQAATLKPAVRNSSTIWFHAASMGELEQIKPIIRQCRHLFPAIPIVVTVFSPSAYRQHHDIPADALLFLPYDRYRSMKNFIELLSPAIVIVSRYDLWWNTAHILHDRGVPILLVNATYPSSKLAQLLRSYYRCLYNTVSLIIARSHRHARFFAQLHPKLPLTVLPDTRIDQVAMIMERSARQTFTFLDSVKLRLVLGSTWKHDEECWQRTWRMLTPEERQKIQLIIVPHEPTSRHCQRLSQLFPEAMQLSLWERECQSHLPSVIVIDRVGLLAALYRHGSAAYVGGGFDRGIHSLLEPALAGVPVACGPRLERSEDAYEMLQAGALTLIRSANDALQWVRSLLTDDSFYHRAHTYRQLLLTQRGASDRVVSLIKQLLPSDFSFPSQRE